MPAWLTTILTSGSLMAVAALVGLVWRLSAKISAAETRQENVSAGLRAVQEKLDRIGATQEQLAERITTSNRELLNKMHDLDLGVVRSFGEFRESCANHRARGVSHQAFADSQESQARKFEEMRKVLESINLEVQKRLMSSSSNSSRPSPRTR